MERDDIIRWIITFVFAISFFVVIYLTIAPDIRIVLLPALGFILLIPLIYILDYYFKESAFVAIKTKAKREHIYIILALAVFAFLIFDFLYISLPGFMLYANFYVGLVLFVFAYIGIAMSGGPALNLYNELYKDIILGIILTLSIGLFSVVSAFFGVILFPITMASIAYPTTLWLSFLLIWALLSAVVEELAFRGTLAPLLASRTGIALSSVIVSLTFMVYHYLAYGLDALALAYLFTLSMMLTLVSLYTRSLLPALIAHTLNNLFAFLSYISPMYGLFAYLVLFGSITFRKEGKIKII